MGWGGVQGGALVNDPPPLPPTHTDKHTTRTHPHYFLNALTHLTSEALAHPHACATCGCRWGKRPPPATPPPSSPILQPVTHLRDVRLGGGENCEGAIAQPPQDIQGRGGAVVVDHSRRDICPWGMGGGQSGGWGGVAGWTEEGSEGGRAARCV